MKKISITTLMLMLLLSMAIAQTPQKPQQETGPEDVVRIKTELVQTDVVVTDKNENIVPDLKLEDFQIYDNGKRQDLKFMEFVSIDTGRRVEGDRANIPATVDLESSRGLSANEVRRVVAFVIDDLTIPDPDLPAVDRKSVV